MSTSNDVQNLKQVPSVLWYYDNLKEFASKPIPYPGLINLSVGYDFCMDPDVWVINYRCIAGVHFLMLTPYQEYGPMSQQQQWLRADLERFDRSKTPWLVRLCSAFIYSYYVIHFATMCCKAIIYCCLLISC